MIKAVAALSLLFSLSGCVLFLEEAVIGEASIGMAARGIATAGLAEGAAVGLGEAAATIGRIQVSEDIAIATRGVKFSPSVRGPLSEALEAWTDQGSQAGELSVSKNGTLSARGYQMARISPEDGVIYGPNYSRLGYISNDATIYEYLTDGKINKIGYLRGFIGENDVPVFKNSKSNISNINIPGNGFVRIYRIYQNGYLVKLESGVSGWVRARDVALLGILSLNQISQDCVPGTGAIIKKNNELIKYDRCSQNTRGINISSHGNRVFIQKNDIANIFYAGTVSYHQPLERKKMIASLKDNGIIFPPDSAYTEIPMGYEKITTSHAPDLENISK